MIVLSDYNFEVVFSVVQHNAQGDGFLTTMIVPYYDVQCTEQTSLAISWEVSQRDIL